MSILNPRPDPVTMFHNIDPLLNHITLEQAVSFIREFEPILAKHGIHSALTGSVLYKGLSTKDFDIILYPRDPKKCMGINSVRNLLMQIGFEMVRCAAGSGMRYNKKNSTFIPSGEDKEGRVVDIMEYRGYRVDVFLDQFPKHEKVEVKTTVDDDVPF